LYHGVKVLIKGLIKDGKVGVTMNEIAARAGTTPGVVSVTLNGAKSKTVRVSAETRKRIMHAAEELGYRCNPFASALATGRSRILGMMLPFVASYTEHDAFFSLLTTGVTACASEHGFNVMLYSAAAEAEGQRAARMVDRLVAGLVLVSPPPGSPIPEECLRQGISFVSVLAGSSSGHLTVDSDDFAGGALATNHLIGRGHRRIAHLEGRPEVPTSKPRRLAYLEALSAAGIEPDPELCRRGDFNRADGYRATKHLLRLPPIQRPTAIFAGNDLSAHGALDAIYDSGLHVPDDIAVVGYDDTWYATVTRPPLTSVRVDVPGIGYRATTMLLGSFETSADAEEHCVLPVSLTIRESCGAPASPAASRHA